MEEKRIEDLQQNILKKSIDFMRSWMRINWDLVLELKDPEIRWVGAKQANVRFEIEDFGRNILFSAFMEKAATNFRLSKNEHGTFIWDVGISFRFKDGGGNGWTYPKNFVLEHGNFIEKVR